MPKEEKQMDLKTGRVRRKAIFGDEEDESGDSDDEDDEEMSESDKLENSSSDDEEEEEDAEMTDKQYVPGKGIKRQKLEMEEDIEVDLPAFADSDDDLERSSVEEEAEEADESSEEEDSTAEEEEDILESKAVRKGSKPGLLETNDLSNRLNLEKSLTVKKATLTTSDSGHCTAEEAFASEDESEENSSLSREEDSENEEVIRKKFPKPSQVVSGQKLGSENLVDETSDIEDLLKEEEDYKEENNYSTETSGTLKFNLTAIINVALKMFYK